MTYIITLDQEELRDYLIDVIAHSNRYELYAVYHKGKYDLFDESTGLSAEYKIDPDRSYNYWYEEYYDYCRSTEQEYNDGLEDDEQLNDEELEDMIQRKREDTDQFRDFMDLAKDHIDIIEESKEIEF